MRHAGSGWQSEKKCAWRDNSSRWSSRSDSRCNRWGPEGRARRVRLVFEKKTLIIDHGAMRMNYDQTSLEACGWKIQHSLVSRDGGGGGGLKLSGAAQQHNDKVNPLFNQLWFFKDT